MPARVLSSLLSLMLLGGCRPNTTGAAPDERAPVAEHPDALPFEGGAWRFEAKQAEVVEHLGRRALKLYSGFAILSDPALTEFREGVIEFDMAVVRGTAFAGVGWHMQDTDNFERFYLRTFLSGSREATQYTPMIHDVSGWQIYHGPNYNQRVNFSRDAWIPFKIVVSGDQAEVWVQDVDASEPLVFIDDLRLDRSEQGGAIALHVEPVPVSFGEVPVYFSNVRVTPRERPELVGQLAEAERQPEGRVRQWQVSSAFDLGELAEATRLPEGLEASLDLSWTPLDSEPTGLANLARVQGLARGKESVFAKVVVESDVERRVRLELGFSDELRLFHDGELVYWGSDRWHSRDITFQGVIGWYDGVVLTLHPGKNELWALVSDEVEMRAGWGLMAAFDSLEGLRIE